MTTQFVSTNEVKDNSSQEGQAWFEWERDSSIVREVVSGATPVAVESKVFKTFQLTLEGNNTALELVARGQYRWHNSWITDEWFVIKPHRPMIRKIVLVEFDRHLTSKDVTAKFVDLGLDRPTYEDAFYFGIQHPNEQRKRPIVFLHEPVFGVASGREVLFLNECVDGRLLGLVFFDRRWDRNYVFAGVRK